MNAVALSTKTPSPPGSRTFRGGAWLLVVVSLGHLFWHVTFYGPLAPADRSAAETGLLQGMAGLRMPYPGPARSLLDFQVGFSVTMGVTMLGLGLLNVALEWTLRKRVIGVPPPLSVVNIAIASAAAAVALVWLAPMPLPFLLGSIVCFSVSALRARSAAQGAARSDRANVVPAA